MKNKIIFAIIAAAILTAAFFLQSSEKTEKVETTTEAVSETATELTTEVLTLTEETTENTSATETTHIQQETTTLAERTTTTEIITVTEEKTTEATTLSTVRLTVDYSILKGRLDKADKNGGIAYSGEYTLKGGESAFDVLKNSMRQAGIPMEFTKTPAYDSYYIEGIDNVYEFDFGDLSGWLYKVNGEFFGYASSEYRVKPGDDIVFVYTCDLGKDAGNDFSE